MFQDYGITTGTGCLKAITELVRTVKAEKGYTRCVEIGSWAGRTALAMVEGGADEVHCIDTWQGSPSDMTGSFAKVYGPDQLFRQFCDNIGPDLLFRVVHPHHGKSLFYSSIWPWEADLVFIDADHDYDMVLADINSWWCRVRDGGVLCGHDFHQDFPGVINAVTETGPKTIIEGSFVWARRKNVEVLREVDFGTPEF